jgi:DNA-binding PadR family transcriptional regulator
VFARANISVSNLDAVPSPAIRKVVGDDWSNRQMNYRLNQLDEAGLVEIEDLKDSVHHYSQAPRACWLTESGWEAFNEWYRAVRSPTADLAELSEQLSALEEGVGISVHESKSFLPERKPSEMTAAPWSGEFSYLDADDLSERVDIVRSRQLYMLGLLWKLKQTVEQTHDGKIEWEDYRRIVDEEVERRWEQLDM